MRRETAAAQRSSGFADPAAASAACATTPAAAACAAGYWAPVGNPKAGCGPSGGHCVGPIQPTSAGPMSLAASAIPQRTNPTKSRVPRSAPARIRSSSRRPHPMIACAPSRRAWRTASATLSGCSSPTHSGVTPCAASASRAPAATWRLNPDGATRSTTRATSIPRADSTCGSPNQYRSAGASTSIWRIGLGRAAAAPWFQITHGVPANSRWTARMRPLPYGPNTRSCRPTRSRTARAVRASSLVASTIVSRTASCSAHA